MYFCFQLSSVETAIFKCQPFFVTSIICRLGVLPWNIQLQFIKWWKTRLSPLSVRSTTFRTLSHIRFLGIDKTLVLKCSKWLGLTGNFRSEFFFDKLLNVFGNLTSNIAIFENYFILIRTVSKHLVKLLKSNFDLKREHCVARATHQIDMCWVFQLLQT